MPLLPLALAVLLTAAPGDFDVVPGERIGRVRLGMKRAEVHAALGKPTGSFVRKDRVREDVWAGARNGVASVRVQYSRDVTAQVGVTSSAFKTPDGLSTGSEPSRIVALRLGREGYWTRGSGGGLAFYYDDVPRGLAWTVTAPGIREPGGPPFRIYQVVVHRPGQRVVVDEDMLPITAAEACIPEAPERCESL